MNIYLAADHGGYTMKEEIKKWLRKNGYTVIDCGNTTFDPEDDYPDFAFPLAEKVAVDVFDLTSVIHARVHNNANIISVGADWLQKSEVMLMIENFLNTQFLEEERHQRRINKISIYELGE